MTTTLDVAHMLDPDQLAVDIGNRHSEWRMLRDTWVEQTKDTRNYVFATDTKTTANALLPWSNTTTTPKLTQIYDNLLANYFMTLFPQMKWMKWQADTQEDATKDKRDVIQSYMENKVAASGFEDEVNSLLSDWLLTGNCFGMVEWVDDYIIQEDGEFIPQYTGPKLTRISPYDITFNPAAKSFANTPKIIRSLKSLGEVQRIIDKSGDQTMQAVFDKSLAARNTVRSSDGHMEKADGFVADGFSSIQMYYESDYVEILTFYGDIYDHESGELMSDRVITVLDRAYVLSNVEEPSWLGNSPIFHSGWRPRPDNLYAMGPLDNLIGIQYRIDHLENLKADVFDQIAYPMLKIKGDVEDFDFEPGGRVFIGEEGDVGYLHPDATALQADMHIQELERRMEELAGAPKQSMGIRTPGEKTAFEVQSLDNSSGRIYQHKTAHFERTFIEKILNAMLAMARRKMHMSDTIRVVDDATGIQLFQEITKEDITAKGKIVPLGARHFAERARRVQNITQMYQIKAQDPTVAPHMSGKEMARIISDELGEPTLFGDNIAVVEQLETQEAMQEGQLAHEESMMAAADAGI